MSFFTPKFLTKITNINIDKDKIIKSVQENDFEKLKTVELNDGLESCKRQKYKKFCSFFNLGKCNWEELLEDDIINKIEKKFYNEMKN